MNGTLTSGSQTANGAPVIFASSIETPVTPPSMKLLESRKPFSPMPADRIPAAISTVLSASRRSCFITPPLPNLPELEGLLRAPAGRRRRIRHIEAAAGGGGEGHGVPLGQAPLRPSRRIDRDDGRRQHAQAARADRFFA